MKLASLLFVLLLSTSLTAAEIPAPPDVDRTPAWPMYHGPFGNFQPRDYGVRLRDELDDSTPVAWRHDTQLGLAKARPWDWVGELALTMAPGAEATPIIAEGKVFAVTFRPNGPVPPVAMERINANAKAATSIPKVNAKYGSLDRIAGVIADDVLVAIDFKTGKSAWEAVEVRAGLSHPMGKRNGFGVSPAYDNGRVFAMGTLGIVRAYRAATGEKLWETDIGEAHRSLVAQRDAQQHGEGNMECSLVVAEGILIVPCFDGRPMSLLGLDPATGKELWKLPKALLPQTTPALFRDGSRTLVLSGGAANLTRGVIRCIDPQNGKVLWSIDDVGLPKATLTSSEGLVCINLPTDVSRLGDRAPVRDTCRLGIYRISASETKQVWAAPDEPQWWFDNDPDSCAMSRSQIHHGQILYYHHAQRTGEPDKTRRERLGEEGLRVLDANDFHEIRRFEGSERSLRFFLRRWEDHYASVPDPNHWVQDNWNIQFRAADDLRPLGEFWNPPEIIACAYMVPLEIPYADGKFIVRNNHGELICYDISQPAAQ